MKRMIVPLAVLAVAITQVQSMATENTTLNTLEDLVTTSTKGMQTEMMTSRSFADMFLLQKAAQKIAALSEDKRQEIKRILYANQEKSAKDPKLYLLLLSILNNAPALSHSAAPSTSNLYDSLSSLKSSSLLEGKIKTITLSLIEGMSFIREYAAGRKGYGVRIGVRDIENNAKNIVLQAKIPSGYCFELEQSMLPLDFTLFSEDNGNTRTKFSSALVDDSQAEDEFTSSMLCTLTHIKVLLPEDPNFFSEDAFGFILKPITTATKKKKAHCLAFTVSADNAHYVEEDVCIE